jgi:integrase
MTQLDLFDATTDVTPATTISEDGAADTTQEGIAPDVPARRRRGGRRRVQQVLEAAPLDPPPEALRARVTTLGDALAVLDTLADLTPAMRKEIRSAVVLLERASNRSADAIGLAPAAMVPLLKPVLPAALRVSGKRWSNARAALRSLAKRMGHHAPDSVLYAELTGRWAELVALLPNHPRTTALRAFARYCIRENIAPEQATEGALEAYRAWLEANTYELNTITLIGLVRRCWNRDGLPLPGWPQHRLVPHANPRVLRLPDAELPPGLLADIETYLARRNAGDALDDGPNLRPIAAATLEDRADRLRLAASVLIRGGMSTEQLPDLRALLTAGNLKTVLRAQRERAGRASFAMNDVHVALAFSDAARVMLGPDAPELAGIELLRQRLKQPKRGVSDRARARLAPLDSPVLRAGLIGLPDEAFAVAERLLKEGRLVRAAQAHERALALALLLLQPMRRRTLAALDIAEHFVLGARDEGARLRIPGDLVKNGVAIDCPLPGGLVRRLRRHLTVFRPLLPGAAETTALFPSGRGDARGREAIAGAVSQLVRDALGTAFNIGMVRHLAATLLYESDPQAGPAAQRLLGHTKLSTTETMYGSLSTRSAHTAWAAVLDTAKGAAARKARRQEARTEARHG